MLAAGQAGLSYQAAFLAALLAVAVASNKKPLFEYDDHYVMLNDFGRNEFYRQALEHAWPAACREANGGSCTVLDVGAGSGLLSMMAANLGAQHVLALEANPALATLAEQTIARNQARFPTCNITVLPELSSKVAVEQLPLSKPADVLVTETFGTMLLGESAMNFIPDARKRLLKEGGMIIPSGGCQYVTLVEAPAVAELFTPSKALGLNLTRAQLMVDTLYWKATMGATTVEMRPLTDRACVLEVDFYRDGRDSIPENRTYRWRARRSGTIHAALFDWDVWADAARTRLLSTAPGSRGFAGDVAWGWLLQMQEAVGSEWKRQSMQPQQLHVEAGDEVDVLVDYIAGGISLHVRAQKVGGGEGDRSDPSLGAGHQRPPMPGGHGRPLSQPRLPGTTRGDMLEANEFYLPVVADSERQLFYKRAVDAALHGLEESRKGAKPTLLDCSGNLGVPALLAAAHHGLHTLTLTRRSNAYAELLRQVAKDNSLEKLVEAYAAEPREVIEALLPLERKADIVVLDIPGTPVHSLSPFALLPSVRKHLLARDGRVVPAGACLEVGIMESDDLAHLFSVPAGGLWKEVDLTVWNEEARRQNVLERVVPYTKWLGLQSTLKRRWLKSPECAFNVDFQTYGADGAGNEEPDLLLQQPFISKSSGLAHAVVARWAVRAGMPSKETEWLRADSDYLGRSLTWPHYVQALAAKGTPPGALEPIKVEEGSRWDLLIRVRQGTAKRAGFAGPEFSFELREAGSDGKAAVTDTSPKNGVEL